MKLALALFGGAAVLGLLLVGLVGGLTAGAASPAAVHPDVSVAPPIHPPSSYQLPGLAAPVGTCAIPNIMAHSWPSMVTVGTTQKVVVSVTLITQLPVLGTPSSYGCLNGAQITYAFTGPLVPNGTEVSNMPFIVLNVSAMPIGIYPTQVTVTFILPSGQLAQEATSATLLVMPAPPA